jgi:hypothetical protein
VRLKFAKSGWRAKPVPKACDYESVGKLDKMAQDNEERKREHRKKAEANYRKAHAPQLSPTKAKRNAKLRESLERRQAAVAETMATAEGQNKENPFDARWTGWLRSEGLQSDEGTQSPAPLLSMRQLQRACRKVAGLPPLSSAEMDEALRKMKVSDLLSPSNPDVACVTAEQAKKWVREQQHIMCWNRVQSSTAGLPIASATKVLADMIADEQRLPETRWPNLGPRHKVPRAHFVEDRPKIVFETNEETHYREVLQMSDAEQMELAKAQAAITVKLMQEQQQAAGAAAAERHGMQDISSHPQESDDVCNTTSGVEAATWLPAAGSQDDEDGEAVEAPLYVKAAEVVTKQKRTEEWVDSDVTWEKIASTHADPRAVTWNDLAHGESETSPGVASATAASALPAAPTEKGVGTSSHSFHRNARVFHATPTPGEKYMERKIALDVQKQELLALEAQRARKRAARAQKKNELLRLAAELPPA